MARRRQRDAPGGETPLVVDTANRIRQLIRVDQPRLPSMEALAASLGVSRPIIMRAALLLRNEGFVEYSAGRRMTVTGALRPPEIPPSPPRQYEIIEFMKARIVQGVYAPGEQLPKVAYVARQFSASTHTVISAYRTLLAQRLAHREGRSLRVGPKPRSLPLEQPRNPKVILLLLQKLHSWRSIGEATRTSRFHTRFTTEAASHHIQLLPVLGHESNMNWVYPGGEAAVERTIRKMGVGYAGTLIAASRGELDNLSGYCRLLLQYEQPVVWFDRYDEEGLGIRSPLLTRCHFSEQEGVTACLQYLVDHGHRAIAYLPKSADPWKVRRGEMLVQTAARLAPDLRVWCADPRRHETDPDQVMALAGSLSELSRTTVRVARERLKSLLVRMADKTYSMVPYLRSPGVTAIVAANDVEAEFTYYWLNMAGIEVPDKVSLVSFDNSLDTEYLPVSTVDFGFGYLGFCSFHSIMQDIPIRRDRDGNVAAKPQVVERGSVKAR